MKTDKSKFLTKNSYISQKTKLQNNKNLNLKKNKNNYLSKRITHRFLEKKKNSRNIFFKINYKNTKFLKFLKAHDKENKKKKDINTRRNNMNTNFLNILKFKNIKIKTEKSAKKKFKEIMSKSPKIIKNFSNFEKIKKEFCKKIFSSILINNHFEIKKIIYTKNFPNLNYISSRNNTASTLIKKNIIILYGGKGYKVFSDLYIINIKEKKIDKFEIKNNLPGIFNIKRYGHKIHFFNGYLYVLGGFAYNNSQKNLYKLSSYKFDNFFFKINLSTKKFEFENLNVFPSPRKNFCSVFIDKNFFLVFGGEDYKNNFLNELWVFSIKKNFWVKLNLSVNTFKFIFYGISKHSMCIISDKNKIDNILNLSGQVLFNRKKSIFTIDEEETINLEMKKKKNISNFFDQRNSNKLINKKNSIFFSKNLLKKNFSINKIEKNKFSIKKNNIKKNNFSLLKTLEENFPLIPTSKIFNINFTKKISNIKNLKIDPVKIKKKKNDFSLQKKIKKQIISELIKSLGKNLILLFGGINLNFGKNPNNLRYLKFNKLKRKFYWKILYTNNSLKPNPTYSNTLNYIKEKNSLILYGGINEKEKYINDFWIFNLNKLIWIKKEVVGDLNENRSGHIAESVKNLFLVFGGINFKGFVDNKIHFGILNQGRRSE